MEKRLANSGKVGIGKVVITGTESTGKTTLAQQVAERYKNYGCLFSLIVLVYLLFWLKKLQLQKYF